MLGFLEARARESERERERERWRDQAERSIYSKVGNKDERSIFDQQYNILRFPRPCSRKRGRMSSKNIPADKINLRLILVSGKTKEFLFSQTDSAGDIALTVFENWPDDWEAEAVAKAEILRLIYQGRFLHCNVTLGALGLPLGKTTVMHLVPRDNLPEPNSQDQRQKSKGGSSRCCSTSCCIL